MAADNYKEILEEVCEKMQSINSVKEIDISDIKNSVESIENLIMDTQAKLKFQEIKDKLETIAYNVDSCNEAFIKNLYNDINELKSTFENFSSHLENIQNNQNLALTNAEFEEYQKHQLDINLKNQQELIDKLEEIKSNSSVGQNSEKLHELESDIESLHGNLVSYIEQITSKMENIPDYDELKDVLTNLSSINDNNINETNNLLKDLQTCISNFNADLKTTDMVNQLSKISAIYESLSIVQAWIEKAGIINKSIENLYSKLGQDIDFNEIEKKINLIYESINKINDVDVLNASIAGMDATIKVTGEKVVKTLDRMTNQLGVGVDFEDISDKVDIIFDNISALNEWAVKIDGMYNSVGEVQNELNIITTSIGAKTNKNNVDFEDISDKVDIIYDNISALNDWAVKIDNVDNSTCDLHNKLDNLASKIDDVNKINQIIKSLKDTILPEDVDMVDIINKIDIVYENMAFINELAGKIDELIKKNDDASQVREETKNLILSKIDEAAQNREETKAEILDEIKNNGSDILYKIGEIHDTVSDVPNISDKLADVTSNLHSVLSDIEADFEKMHESIESNTQITSDDIYSLKARFSDLNDDISSISVRTNKLILTADDANKEFRVYLEAFKNAINEFNKEKKEYNPELRFAMLNAKLEQISQLMHNALSANNNLNKAFIYLGEWVDASGRLLNDMYADITSIRNLAVNNNKDITADDLNDLKHEVLASRERIDYFEKVFTNLKNDDISELKSLLSGIIVQINTSVNPSIDILNEKIDKLNEENSNKIKEFEQIINNKFEEQNRQINNLTNTISDLNNKLDKVIDLISSEGNKDHDIKDMLGFIVSEISNASEYIKNRPASDEVIKKIEQKVASFDTNINKIVSYIEEE